MAALISKERILKELNNIHHNQYDYSNAIYVNTKVKIEIICPTHGSFFQSPSNHRKRGCPSCSRQNKLPRVTQTSILKDFDLVHRNTYNYSKVIYRGATTKVEIICGKHGIFFQTPSAHKNGAHCTLCVKNNRYKTLNQTINQFKKVHNDRYDYSKAIYINNITPLTIICSKHGEFYQRPAEHKRGRGCPHCAKTQWVWNNGRTYKNRKTTLYYIKVNTLYKIGLTLKTVKERFFKELKLGMNIHTVKIWVYDDGECAFDREQKILFENRQYRYRGDSVLVGGGDSELFIIDVLGLDG